MWLHVINQPFQIYQIWFKTLITFMCELERFNNKATAYTKTAIKADLNMSPTWPPSEHELHPHVWGPFLKASAVGVTW